MKNNERHVSFTYLIFAVMFVAAILIGNTLASKQIGIGTVGTPAGILVFPLTYVMSDIVAEVYGFKAMRRIIWIGFAFTALQSGLMALANVLPAPVWYQNSKAFAVVAGLAPRIFLGQVLAYLVGEWANATIISKMKFLHFTRTDSKGAFSTRAVASTVIGEFLDSAIFIPVAFVGVNPLNSILTTVCLQASIKIAYEIIMLPFTNWLVKKVKHYEEIDHVDMGIKYSLIGSTEK